MTVYIDIIFLENLFMNYIIIFATGTILKQSIKIFRTFISSLIGSIYAIISYILKMEIFSNIFLKICLSMAMIYIAFESKTLKHFLKQLFIFYLTSFTFGGVAFALLYFISPQKILMNKGVLIGTYPIKIILIAGILGFILITSAFKNIKGRLTKKDMYCNLKINMNSEYVYTTAIIDTGNFLREPITKIPVIVVEKNVLKYVIPDFILNNLDEIINGEDIDLKEYVSKIRIIPFTSLGKENGMLLGIKIDKAVIETGEKIIKINNVIIGIYDGNLSKHGKYKALVGLEILDSEIDSESLIVKN